MCGTGLILLVILLTVLVQTKGFQSFAPFFEILIHLFHSLSRRT